MEVGHRLRTFLRSVSKQYLVAIMLKTKSIWSPIDRESDGLRILATRFRGRGMGTMRYDVWDGFTGPERAAPEIHASSPHLMDPVRAPVSRRAQGGRSCRSGQCDDQEPRSEVHAPADRPACAARQCHALVPLRRRPAAMSPSSIAEGDPPRLDFCATPSPTRRRSAAARW